MAMHEDHRQRLREHFRAVGLECFEPHNVLELLLFYSIPRRDTNEIAHNLIDHFGTLVNVLDAAPEELCRVEGVGEASATLISLAAQLARRYLAEQIGEKKLSFHSSQEFQSHVAAKFTGAKDETVYLFCLDNAGRLLNECKVSLGTKYSVNLDNRTLLETAFRNNATKVALAHNHPNGINAPSSNDVKLTEAAAKLYREVGIELLDHLIVADGKCFSMAGERKFGWVFLSNVTSIGRQQAADIT
ncbi:MAG: DNA repair protein RadC [Oscillospiraceae bacterium]|jgi:DNA repair protein RadC|nr:DNA repair protein RadC [Oscillospiraceae bacterium]